MGFEGDLTQVYRCPLGRCNYDLPVFVGIENRSAGGGGVPKKETSKGRDNGAQLLVEALLQWVDAFAWRIHRG